MRCYGSLLVLIGRYALLWVLMRPNVSLYFVVRPYEF